MFVAIKITHTNCRKSSGSLNQGWRLKCPISFSEKKRESSARAVSEQQVWLAILVKVRNNDAGGKAVGCECNGGLERSIPFAEKQEHTVGVGTIVAIVDHGKIQLAVAIKVASRHFQRRRTRRRSY